MHKYCPRARRHRKPSSCHQKRTLSHGVQERCTSAPAQGTNPASHMRQSMHLVRDHCEPLQPASHIVARPDRRRPSAADVLVLITSNTGFAWYSRGCLSLLHQVSNQTLHLQHFYKTLTDANWTSLILITLRQCHFDHLCSISPLSRPADVNSESRHCLRGLRSIC